MNVRISSPSTSQTHDPPFDPSDVEIGVIIECSKLMGPSFDSTDSEDEDD